MTDKSRTAGPDQASGPAGNVTPVGGTRPVGKGPAVGRATPSGGTAASGGAASAGTGAKAGEERVVIRDNRKIKVAENEPVKPVDEAEQPVESVVEPEEPKPADDAPEAVTEPEQPPSPFAAELEALRAELDERTSDLQRVSAEYANYRKRVERDRSLVVEQATGAVLSALLPVLDDLDRARDHGDLVGPFGAVAEQLQNALAKFGLTAFGAKGDRFDPTRHEAVSHSTSAEVTEPTCVDVMRRGYLLGERLLRPALVGVADPE